MDEKEAIKILNRRINQLRLKFAITNEDLEAIETALNLLEKKDITIIETKEANRQLSVELQKKDKIIDEMAEEISKSIVNTCPLEDYNVDLDCENKCKDDYKACWKKYFEYKVEESK